MITKSIAVLCVISAAIMTTTMSIPETACQELSEKTVLDTIIKVKNKVMGGEKSFGIDAGSVFTTDYDTGFGVGVHFNQTFEHPYIDRPFLQSSPTVQFWGASNETTDLSVIGIIESLTHRVPMKKGFTAFAGLSFGYYYIYKDIQKNVDEKVILGKINSNSFEIFITGGLEYKLKKKSSVFFQMKYGDTAVSKEIHTIVGLNLNYWKEE